jgi:hypothetical protein
MGACMYAKRNALRGLMGKLEKERVGKPWHRLGDNIKPDHKETR